MQMKVDRSRFELDHLKQFSNPAISEIGIEYEKVMKKQFDYYESRIYELERQLRETADSFHKLTVDRKADFDRIKQDEQEITLIKDQLKNQESLVALMDGDRRRIMMAV